MQTANETELKAFDDKVEDAQQNMGETEVNEALLGKADYYAAIGDKVSLKELDSRIATCSCFSAPVGTSIISLRRPACEIHYARHPHRYRVYSRPPRLLLRRRHFGALQH